MGLKKQFEKNKDLEFKKKWIRGYEFKEKGLR